MFYELCPAISFFTHFFRRIVYEMPTQDVSNQADSIPVVSLAIQPVHSDGLICEEFQLHDTQDLPACFNPEL
jgi:hypothetical protein